MTYFKRFLCVMIMCVLCAQCAYSEDLIFDTASAVEDSDIIDNGLIRVYLASLDRPEAIMITIAGEYTVEGVEQMRFERGTQLVVAADGGRVYMHAGGLTLDMGEGFTLKRGKDNENAENGFYIHESEKNGLYMGDLSIRCEDDALVPILTIGVEDYLCGVVAYEMSDAFPLEALKAQAVAARTYALSKKSARADEMYDVTDTTSDQVYKGFSADYTNVARAVSETCGVVGTYNGGYATCYYTASNGGRVATPAQAWGYADDYGYIEAKDDPYDLENTKSMVNSFVMPVKYAPDNLMWQMIEAKVSVDGWDEFRIDALVNAELTDPTTEDSCMYQTLIMDVSVSVRQNETEQSDYDGSLLGGLLQGLIKIDGKWYHPNASEWESLPDTVRVTFSVYEEIKDGLGIGLNSRDYELTSIKSDGDLCSIEMRRFGHGAGMSQRGAQQMAGVHGAGYIEILNFYYPGMRLERVQWEEAVLPEIYEMPESLETELMIIATIGGDLGPLEDGEYYARVTLADAGSSLNVRKQPDTGAKVVSKLANNDRVVIMEMTDTGWAHVRGAGFIGYVKADYISAE